MSFFFVPQSLILLFWNIISNSGEKKFRKVENTDSVVSMILRSIDTKMHVDGQSAVAAIVLSLTTELEKTEWKSPSRYDDMCYLL